MWSACMRLGHWLGQPSGLALSAISVEGRHVARRMIGGLMVEAMTRGVKITGVRIV